MTCPICNSPLFTSVCSICGKVYEEEIRNHILPPGLEDIAQEVTKEMFPYQEWATLKGNVVKNRELHEMAEEFPELDATEEFYYLVTDEELQDSLNAIVENIRARYESGAISDNQQRTEAYRTHPSSEEILAHVRTIGYTK